MTFSPHGITDALAVTTRNRESRRRAAKFGLTLAELLVGISSGWIATNQRRISPDIRKRIKYHTARDLAAMKKAVTEEGPQQ